MSGQGNEDGSIGRETDIATAFQASAEALRTLAVLDRTGDPLVAPALEYLAGDGERDTEYLARRIIAEAEAGRDAEALVDELLTHRGEDGGFGTHPGRQSNRLLTGLALEALAAAGREGDDAVGYAVGFLETRQAADGSWASAGGEPSLFVTASVMRALLPYRTHYDLAGPLGRAASFLLGARDDGGVWDGRFETALALTVLLPYLDDAAGVETAVADLESARSPDGSWDGDVYVTALALRALAQAGAARGRMARIGGRIAEGAGNAPLPGVVLRIAPVGSGQSVGSVVSGADGRFAFTGLPPGDYVVALELDGYGRLVLLLTLDAGQGVDLPDPTMATLDGEVDALVEGVVRDLTGGGVIAGAELEAAGVAAPSGTDGRYRLRIPPGTVAVTAAALGFEPVVSAPVALRAGDRLRYDPGLRGDDGSPSGRGISVIKFRAVDADSGAPIPLYDGWGRDAGVLLEPRRPADLSDLRGVYLSWFPFTLPNLEYNSLGIRSDRYSLHLYGSGYEPKTLTVNAAQSGTYDLGEVALTPRRALDVAVADVSDANIAADPLDLVVSGHLDAVLENRGDLEVADGVRLEVFYDADRDGIPDPDEPRYGEARIDVPLGPGEAVAASIPIAGSVPYRDAPLTVWADSEQRLAEFDRHAKPREDNNLANTLSGCFDKPEIGFEARVKWTNPVVGGFQPVVVGPLLDTNGDGAYDDRDVPAAVVQTTDNLGHVLYLLDGETGETRWEWQDRQIQIGGFSGTTPALADMDGDGRMDMLFVAYDRRDETTRVFGLRPYEDEPFWRSEAIPEQNANGGITVADLEGDGIGRRHRRRR